MRNSMFLAGVSCAVLAGSLAWTPAAAGAEAQSSNANPDAPASAAAGKVAGPGGDNAAPASGAPTDPGDIVVTARRESENIQNVPVSIQVVTGDSIKKLQITRYDEISKLAPGLTLKDGITSSGEITLRGVRWSSGSGPTATPIYLNESNMNPGYALQSLYDIGQIEVLRGPQGTQRGAPSISGAVTITVHRPDLKSFGGYIQGTVGTHDHENLQGGINVPIIRDVLAVRVAGLIDHTEGDTVRSLNNKADPSVTLKSYRASVRFRPTDTINIDFTYQNLHNSGRLYTQVVGSGSPGNPTLGIPAGYNGPVLTAGDYKAVADLPRTLAGGQQLFTLNSSWKVLGQELTYNFSSADSIQGATLSPSDNGNTLPGYKTYPPSNTGSETDTMHEIRLSSQRGKHFFDYDIGYYHFESGGEPIKFHSTAFLNGAFGRPSVMASGQIVPGGALPGEVTTANPRYVLAVDGIAGLSQKDESFYGNVQFHLPYGIELTGGVRRMHSQLPTSLGYATGSAFIVATPNFGFPCGAFGLVDSAYAGFCDAAVAPQTSTNVNAGNFHKTIYNVSLSKHFGRNVLGYFTTGTSFRPGYPAIGQSGLPANLQIPKPETATSYEVGVKTTLTSWLRINADVFQINYDGQLVSFSGVQYFNTATNQADVTGQAFFSNLNSRVRGAEFEIGVKPLENFTLNGQLSYAKIESRGGLVPATVGACSGAVAVSASNPINLCPAEKGKTLNTSPPWQFNVNGSYDVPLGSLNGYFRFNVAYQGRNPNFQTSYTADNVNFRPTKGYAIVDLFAGINGGRGAWDLGVYAKNVFNANVLLTAQPINTPYAEFGNSGYQAATTTAPREVGISLRYSFGSR